MSHTKVFNVLATVCKIALRLHCERIVMYEDVFDMFSLGSFEVSFGYIYV